MRELLDNALYAPTRARFKVYIIDEVHMLSRSAFNAMLKTLEEPPEHVKFILATTDPQKVPVTVLSRCLQFNLKQIPLQQIRDQLGRVLEREGIAFEAAALGLIGRAALGSMRDGLSLLDQAIAHGAGSVTEASVREMLGAVDQEYLYVLLEALADHDGPAMLRVAERDAGTQFVARGCAAGAGGPAAPVGALADRAGRSAAGRTRSRPLAGVGRALVGAGFAARLSDRLAGTRRSVAGARRVRGLHHDPAAHAGLHAWGGRRKRPGRQSGTGAGRSVGAAAERASLGAVPTRPGAGAGA